MKEVIKADSDSVVSVENVSEDKFYVLEQFHVKNYEFETAREMLLFLAERV